MRLADLEYFLKVSQLGTLNRASESLGISQPALSLSIKRLEKHFNTELFTRHKNGVTLTPAGVRLKKTACQLIDNWNDVSQSVYDAHHAIEGEVTIGAHPLIAATHLPAVLPKLLEKNPKLSIKIISGLSRELNAEINAGNIDIGIIVNPIRHLDLIIKPVRIDCVGFWHHPNYVIDGNNIGTVFCDSNLQQTQFLLKKLKQAGYGYQRLIESDSLELLARLAMSQSGMAIIPASLQQEGRFNLLKNFLPVLFFRDDVCLVFRNEKRFLKTIEAIKSALLHSI